ncbi:uncharacterized protein BCR38DRAFT_407313 [Pseudomassariella vexata]|uniref:CFEM domain-containing protein n=1 Tax=Pseudomassariella vexata TaxID=1141098 RepID=A0A1Y2E701_9PEZI|nr:uncharacterized protein BCR38DRAFT_407313 [Pseudomassariella vexata]ORY67330.1 hypothetical protein BCR38DRAFT_407313 [Pseudomassariella vexata]
MKPTLLLVAAGLAVAQNGGYFPGEPDCAIPCLTSAISKAGCALSDISCQCGPTQSVIGMNAAGCLTGACSADELQQALSAGLAVCSSFSAGDLTITSTAAPTTGTASSSASISITSPPSSTPSSTATGDSTSTAIPTSLASTETLTRTDSTPSASLSSIIASQSSAAGAPARVAGGFLAGLVGIVAAL